MSETIFSILNIQETWESITLQLSSLFNPEKFQLPDSLGIFWDKILNNPLASIITLLVLIGLPYTLIKAKKSNTEASGKLDRLMEEMKDFEFEKPMIDLQENFRDSSPDNLSSKEDDHEVPELSIEEDSVLNDLESASFAKQLILEEKVTDDFLATNSMPLQPEANDENSKLSSLAEEILDKAEISKSVEPSIGEEEFENIFIEDLQISDEDRDLVSAAEESFPATEISQPLEPNAKEHASQDIDDLQTRMEQAIKKLRMNYPPPEETEEIAVEDTSTGSAPSVLEEEESSLRQSHLITHLKSFQKNLENQFDPKAQETKKN